jgi:hypothetical protein
MSLCGEMEKNFSAMGVLDGINREAWERLEMMENDIDALSCG